MHPNYSRALVQLSTFWRRQMKKRAMLPTQETYTKALRSRAPCFWNAMLVNLSRRCCTPSSCRKMRSERGRSTERRFRRKKRGIPEHSILVSAYLLTNMCALLCFWLDKRGLHPVKFCVKSAFGCWKRTCALNMYCKLL